VVGQQKANAGAIVEQVNAEKAIAAQDKRQASIIGLATAMQESSLRTSTTATPWARTRPLPAAQPWGSARRPDAPPHKSAHMFLTGGQGGQRGLVDFTGWQSMPIWLAAQSVQVSAFPTAYAKWRTPATTTR
jgi:hypothetical protein